MAEWRRKGTRERRDGEREEIVMVGDREKEKGPGEGSGRGTKGRDREGRETRKR